MADTQGRGSGPMSPRNEQHPPLPTLTAPLRETTEASSLLPLVPRAVREGWPIAAALKAKCVNAAESILDNPDSSRAQVIAAIRALAALEQLNLYQARTAAYERVGTLAAGQSALRAALASPAAQAIVMALSDAMTERQPLLPPGSLQTHDLTSADPPTVEVPPVDPAQP